MQAQARYAIQMFRWLLGAGTALTLLTTSAAAQQADPRFRNQPSERRILVSLGGADADAGTSSDTISVLSVVGRLSHAATLHRFRVDLLDSTRQRVLEAPAWEVAVFADAPTSDRSQGVFPIAQLSPDAPEIRVPRPYGVPLDPQDAIRIVATLPAMDPEATMTLQITIEYESPDQPVSRLPVLSLSVGELPTARTESDGTGTSRSWAWQPVADGRIVAIAGRHLAGAEALILEDATSGEVLWSTRAQNPQPGTSSGRQGEIIRPSVIVRSGRTYQLRVIYAAASALLSGTDTARSLAVLVR